jgi:signal transduction histidine kinase
VYWLGGGDGNIFRVDPKQGSVRQFKLPLSKNEGVFVRNIRQSQSGDLWLGTDLGVVKFSPQTETFSVLYNSNGSVFISYSRSLMVDNLDRLWIATNGGVAVVPAKQNTAVFFSKEQGTNGTLSHNGIVQIQQNHDGQIMLLTRGGIDVLVEDSAELKRFAPFASEVTKRLDSEQHLLQTGTGNYWIGSQYLVDSTGQLIAQFSRDDGALEQGRSRKMFALNDTDILQFYNGGVVLFHANPTLKTASISTVAVTEATVGEHKRILNYQAPVITVGKDDQQFSVRFAAPLYAASSAVQYRYKLAGYDNNWQHSAADIRQAKYTALPPGRYQLKLQATDSLGQWPERSTNISVIVKPRFYQSWWFRLLALFLLSLLLYLLFRWRLAVAAKQQRELYEKREALQKAQMMTELMEQKNQMLAEVTHDLRTPLAMVKMQLEAMQDGVLEPDEKSYHTLQRRITTLNTMVGDIYQLSVADSGALRLDKKTFDLATLAQHMAESFDSLMQQKQLTLGFEDATEGKALVYADEERITQVLTNLLKNSYRYTDAGGQVCIRVKVADNAVLLEVADSAPAVTEEELARLFERLYRAQSTRGGSKAGSGLGLWISQSIVEAHQGKIRAALSELGGLNITLALPRADSE